MAFTDNCDIFGAFHEEGVNLIVQHLMKQRPSLFNYATEFFEERPDLLCVRIVPDRKVIEADNPLFDVQDPIPVLATPVDVGLDWCLQITEAQIDFHPENVIDLPSELGEIPPQRLALHLKACFGLSCPPADVIEEILPMIEVWATLDDDQRPTFDEPIVLDTRELTCFCLELYGVAHFEWGTIGNDPQQWLKPRLDGLEVVDLQPTPMENIIECYVSTVLRLGVLPGLNTKMEKLIFDITAALEEEDIEVDQQISLQPTPISAAVPFNPAIEADQLKVFINLVVEEV